MDQKLELIKKAALSSRTPSDMAGVGPVIVAVIGHFKPLVEGGSRADLQKLKMILKDAQKVTEATGNDESKMNVGDLAKVNASVEEAKVAIASFVERRTSPTKQLFSGGTAAEETPPKVATKRQNDGKAPTAIGDGATADENNNDDDDDEDEEEEEEKEQDPDPQIVAMRQEATRSHRWLQLGIFVVIVLACVGVVFVSKSELLERRVAMQVDTTNRLLSMALDGLDIAAQNDTTAAAAAAFLDTLTRGDRWGSVPSADAPLLVEFYGAKMTFRFEASTRVATVLTTPRYPLLCVNAETPVTVLARNDIWRPVTVESNAFVDVCPRSSIMDLWRRSQTGKRIVQPKDTTYRGVLASTATQSHNASGIVVGVSLDMLDVADLGAASAIVSGVNSPLTERWEQDAALWIAFTIGIGFVVILFTGEYFSFRQSFYRRRRHFTVLYPILVAAMVVAIVAIAGAATWRAQTLSLRDTQLRHTELLRNTFLRAVRSASLSWAQQQALASRLVASSLAGTAVVAFGTTVTPAAMAGDAEAARRAMTAANVDFASSLADGKAVASALWRAPSGATGVIALQQPLADTATRIGGSGRKSAGAIVGAGFATLLLMGVYLHASGLFDTFGLAFGGQELLYVALPFATRYVAYALISAVMLGTTVALSFHIAAEVRGINARTSGKITSVLSHAATTSAVLAVPKVNDREEGFTTEGEFMAFRLSPVTQEIESIYPALVPPVNPATWQKDFLASRLALSWVTAVLPSCLSYFRGAVNPAAMHDPSEAVYSIAATSYNATAGVGGVFYQDRDFDRYNVGDFLLFLTMITTMLLALILALSFAEDRVFKAAAEEDSELRAQHFYLGVAALILPAFALLIGAAASRPFLVQSVNEFTDLQLVSAVTAVSKLVQQDVALNVRGRLADADADAIALQRATDLIRGFNAQLEAGLLFNSRWVLLQNATPFFASSSVSIGGSGTTNFSFQTDWSAIANTGTVASTLFNESDRSGEYRFAAAPLFARLPLAQRAQSAVTLLLLLDPAPAQAQQTQVWKDATVLAGASVVATFLLISYIFYLAAHVTVWYNVPTVNINAILPSLPVTESSKPYEPSPLPRYARLCHVATFAVPVAVLLAFAMSCFYYTAVLNRMGTPKIVFESYSKSMEQEEQRMVTAGVLNTLQGKPVVPTPFRFDFKSQAAKGIVLDAVSTLERELNAISFADSSLLVQDGVMDYNELFAGAYATAVDEQIAVRNSIPASMAVLVAILNNFHLNGTGLPFVRLPESVRAGWSLTVTLDYVIRLQSLERLVIASLINLNGRLEDDFYESDVPAALEMRERIAAAKLEMIDAIKIAVGYVLGNMSQVVRNNELANSAMKTFEEKIAFFTKSTPIADNEHRIWELQRLRIADIRVFESPQFNLSALSNATSRYYAATLKARAVEDRTRELLAFAVHNTRVVAPPAPDRLASIASFEQTTTAIVVCAVLVLCLSQAANVWLSLTRAQAILRHSHKVNLNTVVLATKNSKYGKTNESDQLIAKTADGHYKQFRRMVVLSTLLVLAACIPSGLGYWVAHSGVATARVEIATSTDSLEAFHSAEIVTDKEATRSVVASAILDVTGTGRFWERYYNTVISSQFRILSNVVRKPFDLDRDLAADRNAQFSQMEADIKATQSCIALLDAAVQRERNVRGFVINSNLTRLNLALRDVSLKAQQVLNRTLATPLLAQLAPFSTSPGNVLGDYFTSEMVQNLRIAVSAVTLAEQLAEADAIATKITTFTSYTSAVLVENRIFTLMILGTVQEITAELKLANVAFVNTLINLVLNTTIKSLMRNRFASVLGNFTSDTATQSFFGTVAKPKNLLSEDLADMVALAAQSHQFSRELYTMAELMRLFAFNRGLYPTAIQSEGRPSLVSTLATLKAEVNGLLEAPSLLHVKTVETPKSFLIKTEAVIDSSPRGLNRLATARSAVQWSFIVAFWALFAGFAYACWELRLL